MRNYFYNFTFVEQLNGYTETKSITTDKLPLSLYRELLEDDNVSNIVVLRLTVIDNRIVNTLVLEDGSPF